MKRLSIGMDDFSKIVTGNYYFVDKSLFIKEVFDEGSEAVLLTRPRRFGKTLNMRMLYYFFSNKEDSRDLFKGLKIEKSDVMTKLNQYPVIYMTFKDIKDRQWNVSYKKLCTEVAEVFKRHKYLLDSLDEVEVNFFNKIIFRQASKDEYENAIPKLTEYLHNYYDKPAIILLDEYDVPIQSGYMNGFYDDVVDFMRNFMSAIFKGNPHLFKGVMTGIYRVSKESIFSGLNNLKVYTILDDKFATYFGFIEEEVRELLEYYGIKEKIEEVRKWYNGYIFGNEDNIYNPWSIINFIGDKKLRPYWINTSSNDLIKEQVAKNNELEIELPSLLEGREVEKAIRFDTSLRELSEDDSAVWSLLVLSGYLKARYSRRDGRTDYYFLSVPNEEVKYFFEYTVATWLKSKVKLNGDYIFEMMESLLSGDVELFKEYFQQLVMRILSYYDLSENESEKVYKVFVLGLLTIAANGYRVRSEKESGLGRYDIAIEPKDTSKYAVIMEFKAVRLPNRLEEMARKALAQIEDKNYAADFKTHRVIKLGIAIYGKSMVIKHKR